MNTYKLFMKLIRRMGMGMTITMLILLIAVPYMTKNLYVKEDQDFSYKKTSVKIINYDKNDKITQSLVDFLEDNTDLGYIEDDATEIANSVFYQDADYVLRIPKGFGTSILSDTPLNLEKKVRTGAGNSILLTTQVDVLIDSFVKNLLIYHDSNVDNLSLDNVLQKVKDNLANNVSVDILKNEGDELGEMKAFANFTQFLSYCSIACFITALGYTFLAMYDRNIMMRENLGNITAIERFRGMLLGTATYGVIFWIICIFIISLFIYSPEVVYSRRGLLLIVISGITNLAILALAYMIASLVKVRGAVEAISLILSLGLSFGSGVFTPKEMVSDILLNASSIAPLVWQVKANEIVTSVSNLKDSNFTEINKYILIIFALTITYLVISFVFQRQRLYKDLDSY